MLDKATKHGESTVKTLWSLNGAGWVRMIKKKLLEILMFGLLLNIDGV